ncbi:MAG: alkaline phosphatase family protein [Oligoflexia bacterium]|nr:alkaline phosphatase family protein [Oligoflexia bacterium]
MNWTRNNLLILICALLLPMVCKGLPIQERDIATLPSKIAFGSCLRLNRPSPILETLYRQHPDLWIMMGDNIYADTSSIQKLRADWQSLRGRPDFVPIWNDIPLIATWDDHDFGKNDAGFRLPTKRESQRAFLDFLDAAPQDPRRGHAGVYTSYYFGSEPKRLQILLLDTRYFRDDLNPKIGGPRKDMYLPSDKPWAGILGETQWKWLINELQEPAALRIIVSSIQFLPVEHDFEKWGNFPVERERLLRELTHANGGEILVLSGDRHVAEISAADAELSSPLFEITSSSLNASLNKTPSEPNRYRIGEIYPHDNFGALRIDWTQTPLRITAQIIGIDGVAKREIAINGTL